ncbi:hypothetical protein AMECASPLE_025860 [Ameca splendens]|uniref:Uncharacterized protein n=1 Tax=Ameca splendens TaxID=208324 RepID=A0ABV0XHR4_9TELE
MGLDGVLAAQMTQAQIVYPPIWHAAFVTCHPASLPSFLSVSSVKYQTQQKYLIEKTKHPQISLKLGSNQSHCFELCHARHIPLCSVYSSLEYNVCHAVSSQAKPVLDSCHVHPMYLAASATFCLL